LFSDGLHERVLSNLAFSGVFLVLGRPEHSSLSTDTQNVNAIQKLLSGLKNILQKPNKAFHVFW
jgi:hypothetical protein